MLLPLLLLLTSLAGATKPDRAQTTQGTRRGVSIGPRIGGGGLPGGTVSWNLGTGTLVDLGLSVRPAVRDLEWNATLMASAGVGRELWGDRARQGLFVAAGSSIPGLPYYESYLAGGYHFRLTTHAERFGLQLRLGGGVMPYGELDGHSHGARPMLYLSADPLWLVKGAR